MLVGFVVNAALAAVWIVVAQRDPHWSRLVLIGFHSGLALAAAFVTLGLVPS